MAFRSAIGSLPVPPTLMARKRATYFVMRGSVQCRRLRLQARQELGRTLHRQPLWIQAQPIEAAQFLASARTAGAAMVALGHDDAMAGMRRGDRCIDHEQAAMARADAGNHPRQEILVLAVD